MANVFDVAHYILSQKGEMSAMKLQKLVYYSQAWHIVWDEENLFDEVVEAWANGPVSPDLYALHRGQFIIGSSIIPEERLSHLSAEESESIDIVIETYGDKNAQWLSDLTHKEAPWKLARERACAPEGSRCSEAITAADMHEYYSGLSS